jgi:predicted O-linked N-acetylglucosamine transferase (SPINDLY family)
VVRFGGIIHLTTMADITIDQAIQLALEHQSAGRHEQAVVLLSRVAELAPRWPDVRNQIGISLQHQGRHEPAIEAFRKALDIDSNYAAAHGNLATSLAALGRRDEAIAAAKQCVELVPDVAEAWSNLGNLLRDAGRFSDSTAAYHKAIRLRPQLAELHNNLGNVLKDQCAIDAALASFRRAVEIKPDYHAAWSNLLYTMHFSPALSPREIFEQHVAWAKIHADPLTESAPPHANDRDTGRRLRVGLVSPDFREHPVGRFIMPLMREHDSREMEIYCYSDVANGNGMTLRLRERAEQWIDATKLDDAQLAARVCNDRIDILIDLAGHTAGNRLLAFARKPAPVQMTYLGYPDTTGMAAMDWRISDGVADPSGDAESLHCENLLRLTGPAWCFDPPTASPDVECAGDDGRVTFGCFNALAKLNPAVLATWATIVAQMTGARLVIKSVGASDEQVAHRLRHVFASAGVEPDRIELLSPMAEHQDHLAAYRGIDIALDPFPYCGTMTTCEALWMGVPVVTLAGATHLERVGASLLTACDLPDFIARDRDEYVQIAAELARDPARRVALRSSMRNRLRHSPLTDAALFARGFERAMRDAWRAWCSRTT